MKHKKILMNYFIGILLILFFVPHSTEGQSIKRQNISSFAATSSFDEITLRQSVGQPFHTKANFEKGYTVLQGFQQPQLFAVEKSKALPEQNLQLSIFPNPANLSVTINSPEGIENPVIQVTDVYGKILFMESPLLLTNFHINCEKWQNGIYFIYVKGTDARSNLTKLIIYK
jgi:hypothetical protein